MVFMRALGDAENIHPKSIAREMFELYRSFSDYVREYGLQASEGLLLRHLSSAHKILCQTVPDGVKDDTVREMELYLGAMIRQVDSSLLDEWEKMRDPAFQAQRQTEEMRPPGAEEAAQDVTRDSKAVLAAIRNRIFTFLRAVVIGEYDQALAALGVPEDPDGELLLRPRGIDAHRPVHLAGPAGRHPGRPGLPADGLLHGAGLRRLARDERR